jgi:hypothetical protein
VGLTGTMPVLLDIQSQFRPNECQEAAFGAIPDYCISYFLAGCYPVKKQRRLGFRISFLKSTSTRAPGSTPPRHETSPANLQENSASADENTPLRHRKEVGAFS